MWRVPLMSSCAEHGCQLEPEPDVRFAALAGNPVEPEAAAAATAALDRLTFRALTAGRVSLPGGSAHAGVWFRLLRTILDELSVAPSALTATSAAIVRSVWAAAGAPPRAGLTVWRPYEVLRQPARSVLGESRAATCDVNRTGRSMRATAGRGNGSRPLRSSPPSST